ncbi:hypothetical protein GWK47_046654 [Chionoecetes opilio]|uniref:Uncharacterized protein n=1 Tax=Chionoecetes opilio TaxID=41210 RepID=A0A8J4Y5E0_CHIOP|nr:hypothetical protein GWK47_046654 [Chionoecetes opilio]
MLLDEGEDGRLRVFARTVWSLLRLCRHRHLDPRPGEFPVYRGETSSGRQQLPQEKRLKVTRVVSALDRTISSDRKRCTHNRFLTGCDLPAVSSSRLLSREGCISRLDPNDDWRVNEAL